MKKLFNIITVTLVSVSLVSCARYSAQPLCELSTTTKSNGIGIASRAFTPEESKRYLGQNLQRSGIQPIQLYIENSSDQSYVFDPTTTNLSLIPPEKIAKQLHSSTFARSALWSVASVPFLMAGLMGMMSSGNEARAAGALVAGASISLPLSQGMTSAVANTKMDRNYAAKGAKEIKLEPHSSLNCVLFVKEGHSKKAFSITLNNNESGQILKFTTQVSYTQAA